MKIDVTHTSYEMGVLLYNTTIYGHVDFNLSGTLNAFMNAYEFDEKYVFNGFLSESINYMEAELCDDDTINENKVRELFNSTVVFNDGKISFKEA